MYRLCVIPICVPPLRERGPDALLLASMFLARLNEENGTARALTAEARRQIMAYRWPGNVRELKNVVHRAYVLSDNDVDLDLDDASAAAGTTAPAQGGAVATGNEVTIRVGTSLDTAERALIMATLRSLDGSKVKAAQVLGISLKTLYNRLHAYGGIARATFDSPPEEASDVQLAV